jgi:S-adenosylmethionine-diacylgycerolhomoserine-N-methlytransferase
MAAFISMRAAPSPDTHAGLMDRIYRRQRYIYDFTRKYYLFGRDKLIARLALEPGANLVEVGCGTARNLIAIARAYPKTQLYGLDASEAMLETARIAVRRAGLEHRITLMQGLAEHLTPVQFGVEGFENVLFSYSLSMIPDWRAALAAGSRSLSPAGRLHIVDFGDLTGFGGLAEHAMRAWLGLFHVTPRVEFLEALERVAGNNRDLTLLFGRYAFILSSAKT